MGLVAVAPSNAGAQGVLDASTRLPAGSRAAVRVEAPKTARICSFAGQSKGASTGSLEFRVARPIVAFTWTVPANVRPLAWRIAIRCAGKRSGLHRAKPYRVRLRVVGGKPHGARRLFGATGLKVRSTRPTRDGQRGVIGGGAVAEGGKGGGCADAYAPQSRIDNTYCTGYCTWYAWSRRKDLQGLGHARDWLGGARARGIPTGAQPVVGAVAWWDGRSGGGYGHVAYVEEVAGNRVRISEMNYQGWNVTSQRWITLGTGSAPHGYIYGGPAAGGSPAPANNPTPAVTALGNALFVKLRNVGSGSVEAHSSNGIASGTRFSPADAGNGTWGMLPNGDVFFVKTRNVGSGSVEVHTASAASGYRSGVSSATRFSPADAGNGTWGVLPNGDVFFVKTRNVGSGSVEVHTASAASGYRSGVSSATRFSPADAGNGTWGVLPNGDVFFVKTRNVGSGSVEIHTASAASGYRSGVSSPTRFSPADAGNGTWGVLPNGDVFFVKTRNVGSGSVEIHTASAASGYRSGVSSPTRFNPVDADNGTWGAR